MGSQYQNAMGAGGSGDMEAMGRSGDTESLGRSGDLEGSWSGISENGWLRDSALGGYSDWATPTSSGPEAAGGLGQPEGMKALQWKRLEGSAAEAATDSMTVGSGGLVAAKCLGLCQRLTSAVLLEWPHLNDYSICTSAAKEARAQASWHLPQLFYGGDPFPSRMVEGGRGREQGLIIPTRKQRLKLVKQTVSNQRCIGETDRKA
ncbi:hypothetical protein AOLI_G00172490 [Acnodon oligacanthus]